MDFRLHSSVFGRAARVALALLLLLAGSLAGAQWGTAAATPKPPKPAAAGKDLSKSHENPLLTPELEPIGRLRMELHRHLKAQRTHHTADPESAFDAGRNGAVVYLNPVALTKSQRHRLFTEAPFFSDDGKYALGVTTALADPLRGYLKPAVRTQLAAEDFDRLIAVTALNYPNGDHSEAVIQRIMKTFGIPREAIVLAGSGRRQCGECNELYDEDVPKVYGHAYGFTAAELARRAKEIDAARARVKAEGKDAAAQDREQRGVEHQWDLYAETRAGQAKDALVTDLGEVRKELERQAESGRAPTPFAYLPKAAGPCAKSQALGAGGAGTHTVALGVSAPVLAPAGAPCGGSRDASAGTAMGSALSSANGGIDFSTLQLRYLADPGDGSGLQYSFSAGLDPMKGDNRTSTGAANTAQSSNAFFVWLSLDPSAFWVNLNPNEPDRIVDARLGRTETGKVLLEADLRMKKSVGKLINPHTALGRQFWDRISGNCMSFRTWIVPSPASVHQDGDRLFILKAPLNVKMETDYLKGAGQTVGGRSCARQDKATEDHNEALFRGLVLPRLKQAINTAPEYAALRRVYLSRVGAEWYRDLSRTRHTTYGKLVDSGSVKAWPVQGGWTPRQTFDRYVDSYTKGEFKITDRTRRGNTTYIRSYVYGGVDFSRVPFRKVPDRQFAADYRQLARGVGRSVSAPSSAAQGDTVWLGAPTPRQAAKRAAAAAGPAAGRAPGSPLWALGLLPLLVVPAGAWLWHRRRTSSASAAPAAASVSAPGGPRPRR